MFLAELLKKSARGHLLDVESNPPVLYRASVIAVDPKGGSLENPNGGGSFQGTVDGKKMTIHASIGPANPRNSVKARILDGGFDQFMGDEEVRTFWPFFPEHLAVPLKPGEHVYVLFEDRDFSHGLWISKVSGHENLNKFDGRSAYDYKEPKGSLEAFSDSSDDEPGFQQDDSYASERNRSGDVFSLFKDS